MLFWVAALLLPFSVVGAVIPGLGLPVMLAGGLLLALAVVDAASAVGVLDGISVQLPDVVRLSKDREGGIEVEVNQKSPARRGIRVGLPFPPEIFSAEEAQEVGLSGEKESTRFEWPCTAVRRGRYVLEACYLEAPSPLGFWLVRRRQPVVSELRVYPNLMNERRSVAALFLHRGLLGIHAQRQVGKGRDFEKLRDYIPGDSYEDIHWKATAKRGEPVTKIYQIERTQEVYVVIDSSRLSARLQPLDGGPGPAATDAWASAVGQKPAAMTTLLERFITSALMLGIAAEQQGDLFGLVTFSDKVDRFVRAKNGKAHYDACREALYTLEARTVTPDFDELGAFIRMRLRKRALMVFLTSLDDPVLAESFVRNMDLICKQHLILVNMVQPPGVRPLFGNEEVKSAGDLYGELGGHMRWQKLREVEKVLKNRGISFAVLENERLCAEMITQYLNVKRRQIL